ncbi:TPA: alanine racemase [Morganella morganii]
MPRPIQAVIDSEAVRDNLARVKERVSPSRVWAVVKADAYGHGIERIFPALAQAEGIALLDFSEAVKVRELGWEKPVLLLEGFFQPQDLSLIDHLQLSTSVHSEWQLKAIEEASLIHPLNVYLKLNSGMNRLGFSPAAYLNALQRLTVLPQVGTITLMSHFADADLTAGIHKQMSRIALFSSLNLPQCLANSAAAMWEPDTRADEVRCGIILYGVSPSGNSADIAEFGLKPAMTLRSEIIAVHDIDAGETVGYGSRFTAAEPMRIATIACGYADGYPRHAPDGTPVWIAGQRCPLAGRISMDMLTVDITRCPQADIGTPVELWGANLPVDDVAQYAGTIGYELLTALARRVPVTTAG